MSTLILPIAVGVFAMCGLVGFVASRRAVHYVVCAVAVVCFSLMVWQAYLAYEHDRQLTADYFGLSR